jgi:peptidyl-prolyl cis-trans isomerase A (cyclophilin A)
MKAAFACAGVALVLAACTRTEPEPVPQAAASTVAPAAAPPPPAAAAPAASAPLAGTLHPALLDPSKATEKAPAAFKAKFTTSRGDFVIEVHRDWAPNGADRFYNLVKSGFFDDTRFFRAISGFMVQFGISGDPAVAAKWQNANIPDDPVVQSNKAGFVTFAQTNMPNSRSTQVFINYGNNVNLDGMRFAPFGQVTEGMNVVESLFTGYGEGAPGGAGPSQGRVQMQGNAYLDQNFPKLDAIKHAEIVR